MLATFLQMKKLMEILFLVEDGEKVKRGLTVTVGMTVSEVDRVNRWVRSLSARLFHSPVQGDRGAGQDPVQDQGVSGRSL